jgi:sigma-B regulation protein RsbU (phosphoserine phosphatase)
LLPNLLNIAPCSIIAFSPQGIIHFANETLLNQLGYTSEELEGQHFEKILTLASRIFYHTHFAPMLTLEGKATELFITLHAKNNEPVPVLVNAVKHVEKDNSYVVCACMPVFERKKYEDEILQAKKIAEEALQKNDQLQKVQSELELQKQQLDQQVTQLKYRNKELLQLNDLVAHDLQEPVRKITLYADKLMQDKEKTFTKKTLSEFETILRAAKRIRTLLTNLQEYIHLSTKEQKKEQVDLNEIITSQLKIVAQSFTNVDYLAEVEELPMISADKEQLAILFCELIKNCFKFRSLERNLHIIVSGVELQHNFYNSIENKYKYVDFVKITIEDNGTGFDKKYKELIFRILKKLHLQSQGLGFGLAVCKRIVENHHGFISVTAEENKGACFTIGLPMQ